MPQIASELNRVEYSQGRGKMASVAEKNRRKKAVTVARASEVKVERQLAPAPGTKPVVMKRYDPIETGLVWLRRKRRISGRQHTMGDEYAEWFRGARLSGAEHLRSCLESDMPRGGERSSELSKDYPATVAWLADCKAKLTEARAVLNFHAGMIAVLDLICGAGMKPREISTSQRETEQMETTLRLALDQLEGHFRARK